MSTPQDNPASRRAKRIRAFAQEEVRLISTLVMLIGVGLFMALPFFLSIGAVVFLPLVAAIILGMLLSPLADRLVRWGVPNWLASMLSILLFAGAIVLVLALILNPAIDMLDSMQDRMDRLAQRFGELQSTFGWVNELNQRLSAILGHSAAREVVVASPSMLEELALATPSVVIEILLTLLMGYFIVESRIRVRNRLMYDHDSQRAKLVAARALRDVQERVSSYLLTVTAINLIVGIIVAAGAQAMGLEAPIMWGGLAAFLNFLPYVGPLAMTALLALFGLGSFDHFLPGMAPAAAYLALHAVEANVVTPSILGARFTMNPVLILVSISYFTWIWGFAGALLSVPILLTIVALMEHLGRPNMIGFLFGEPLFEPQFSDPAEIPPEDT